MAVDEISDLLEAALLDLERTQAGIRRALDELRQHARATPPPPAGPAGTAAGGPGDD